MDEEDMPVCKQCDDLGWCLMRSTRSGKLAYLYCVVCRNPKKLPKPALPQE